MLMGRIVEHGPTLDVFLKPKQPETEIYIRRPLRVECMQCDDDRLFWQIFPGFVAVEPWVCAVGRCSWPAGVTAQELLPQEIATQTWPGPAPPFFARVAGGAAGAETIWPQLDALAKRLGQPPGSALP